MKCVALLLLSVAVPVYCVGTMETHDGCGELGCLYNEHMEDAKQGNFLPENEICIFRGMPINCNKFLRMPCIFSNMGPVRSQVNKGSRTKRQVATGAAAVSSTQGIAYPMGYGGYPFMGGYGYYG